MAQFTSNKRTVPFLYNYIALVSVRLAVKFISGISIFLIIPVLLSA